MTLIKPVSVEPLWALPNVTDALADELCQAGVPSSEALETIGAESAWELLKWANLHPNLETLFALEGAIERTAWQTVPAARRFELMQFMVRHAA